MLKLFGLLVVVVLIGLGWYVYQGGAQVPTSSDVGDTVEDVMTNGSAGADVMMNQMPTMESPMTNEMMVETVSAKTFNLTGKSFGFSQKEIRVKKGDTVTVNFESTGGLHDFTVDEFKAKTQQVESGMKTSTTFVADKTGTFEYYCSVGQHRKIGMVGKLIVE